MPAAEITLGQSFAFTKIELTFGALPIAGIKSIKYDDDLKRTNFYGTGSVQIGLTQGSYVAKGSVTFRKNAFVVGLLNQLGPGFRQVPGQAIVSYGPNGNGLVVVDTLPQLFIGAISADNEQSDEAPPLDNEVNFYVPVPILWNGVPSVIETFPALAVA